MKDAWVEKCREYACVCAGVSQLLGLQLPPRPAACMWQSGVAVQWGDMVCMYMCMCMCVCMCVFGGGRLREIQICV